MRLFYGGLAILIPSGTYLVWKVKADYESKQKLAQSTAVVVWIWYLFHALLTAYTAWQSVWSLPVNGLLAALAGSLLSGAGLAVAAAGVWELHSLQRMSGRAADELVTSGIYRWSRNPQNVGWFLVLLGVSIIGRSAGATLLVAVFALTLHFYIVYVEEPYLAQSFGDAYERYRATTARYWGKPQAQQRSE